MSTSSKKKIKFTDPAFEQFWERYAQMRGISLEQCGVLAMQSMTNIV